MLTTTIHNKNIDPDGGRIPFTSIPGFGYSFDIFRLLEHVLVEVGDNITNFIIDDSQLCATLFILRLVWQTCNSNRPRFDTISARDRIPTLPLVLISLLTTIVITLPKKAKLYQEGLENDKQKCLDGC